MKKTKPLLSPPDISTNAAVDISVSIQQEIVITDKKKVKF
jgi:hypothetical protein